jgi:hypothetical protein
MIIYCEMSRNLTPLRLRLRLLELQVEQPRWLN